MKTEEFDYNLPEEKIAQKPASPRDSSKLLVLENTKISDHTFSELPDLIPPNSILVFNNSKVFPAKFSAKTKEGKKISVLLQKKISNNKWTCILTPGVKNSKKLIFSKDTYATIDETPYEIKERTLTFNLSDGALWQSIEKNGHTPLPPYIKPSDNFKQAYQTIYADKNKKGSTAAPTAGLHFTENTFKKLKEKNIQTLHTTLHVGLGTFEPVYEKNIKDHKIHSEYYEMDQQTYAQLKKAKEENKNIIAVGTTSLRVLETVFQNTPNPTLSGKTNIFIYPPYQFKIVNQLITNFHTPKSTLLMLVSALAGTDTIKAAYSHALSKNYRFLSFGDAMYIKKS